MKVRSVYYIAGCVAALALVSMQPAKASLFTYEVNIALPSNTLTGEIVLNCDSCDVTTSSLSSWTLHASPTLNATGTGATFSGVDLSATPSAIIFTPTIGADTIFAAGVPGNNLALFFGSVNVAGFCGIVGAGSGSIGACENGGLLLSTTTSPLTIATIAAAAPEPSTWAMMILGFAGIGAMTYRRRKVVVAKYSL
jgi:PEP-CTERM motif